MRTNADDDHVRAIVRDELRRIISTAHAAGDGAAPARDAGHAPRGLALVLDAWEALCVLDGRQAIEVRSALASGREDAVAALLDALRGIRGKAVPREPHAVAVVLRGMLGKVDARGRRLERRRGRTGLALWWVG